MVKPSTFEILVEKWNDDCYGKFRSTNTFQFVWDAITSLKKKKSHEKTPSTIFIHKDIFDRIRPTLKRIHATTTFSRSCSISNEFHGARISHGNLPNLTLFIELLTIKTVYIDAFRWKTVLRYLKNVYLGEKWRDNKTFLNSDHGQYFHKTF
jgi:hypothetical protein